MTNSVQETFFIIKPDAIEKGHVGKILSIAEKNGLKIKALKVVPPSRQLLSLHYFELIKKPFFKEVLDYMTRTSLIVGVFEGESAVSKWRELLGDTDPGKAKEGTIRSKYGDAEKFENAAHGSSSVDAAEKEIALWFPFSSEKLDMSKYVDPK